MILFRDISDNSDKYSVIDNLLQFNKAIRQDKKINGGFIAVN